jgi:hypothetical protein|tara:strand:- start:716 stop:1066 length:351 start_codon:yes stop_codon:yes gene_type:complete
MDVTTKIMLFIVLLIIGRYYYNNWKSHEAEKAKITWPVKISQCPDYWIKTKEGKCKNMFDIGKCPTSTASKGAEKIPQGSINFNTKYYSGKNGKVNKCRWAQRCKNSWEGIDNLCA